MWFSTPTPGYRACFSENRIHATVYDLQRVCTRIEIAGELRVVADDPDDDKFVECALVAGASIVLPANIRVTREKIGYTDEHGSTRILHFDLCLSA